MQKTGNVMDNSGVLPIYDNGNLSLTSMRIPALQELGAKRRKNYSQLTIS